MPEATRIRDLPDSEKPRERLLTKGAEALKDSELIAILLRTGTQGLSAIDVAQSLLNKFGSLDALAKAPIEELSVKGVGRDKAVTLKSAFSLAKRLADELRHESPVLDTPAKLANLLREDNRLLEVEHFMVVLVNTKRRLIRVETLAQGTLDSLVTHPREPLSRDKLMNLARGRDYSALERSIDVQVSRLRRMLEEDPANPRYIQTVWGLGYVFVPDGEQV